MTIKAVDWFEEGLDKYYGHDNQGFVYGVYYYEDGEDFPTEVMWFKSENERDETIKTENKP